jgi:hypothetical protein
MLFLRGRALILTVLAGALAGPAVVFVLLRAVSTKLPRPTGSEITLSDLRVGAPGVTLTGNVAWLAVALMGGLASGVLWVLLTWLIATTRKRV